MEQPAVGRRIGRIGVIVTLGYMGSIAAYSLAVWPLMLAMKPDGAATFMSGVFAPVAFLWLVLGFMQQGVELRHSARALYLQQEELQNSVAQQQALVEVTREQLELERAARLLADEEVERLAKPWLILRGNGWSRSAGVHSFRFTLVNLGMACTRVRISTLPGSGTFSTMALNRDEDFAFSLEFGNVDQIIDTMVFVTFVDSRGRAGTLDFVLISEETPDGFRQFKEPDITNA